MTETTSAAGLRAAPIAAALMLAVLIAEAIAYPTAPLQQAMQHPLWLPATAAVLAALGLLLWALPALADAQGTALGRWGRRGALLAVFGTFLNSGLLYTHTFVTPVLASDFEPAYAAFYGEGTPPAGLLVAFVLGRVGLHVGLITFGVASLRAGVVPRFAAGLVALGGLVNLLTFAAGLSILAGNAVNLVPIAGLAMMGLALRSTGVVQAGSVTPAARPSTVS